VTRVQIVQSADPAFLVRPDFNAADRALAQHSLTKDSFIAVALRPWPGMDSWLSAVSAGLKHAREELGVPVALVPMQKGEDTEPSRAVDGPILDDLESVRAVKGVIARSGLVVAMRLHALIFAAGESVPFVPIVYDPKVSSFAALAGQSEGVDISSVTAKALADSIRQAWQERDTLKQELQTKTEDCRLLALKSGEIAAGLLR
jgi:polysaccharide pyruvyl transferase WcaK-like protein